MNRGARDFDRLFPLIYALIYAAVALSVQLAMFPIGDLGTESDFYGDLVIAAQRLWGGEFSVLNYPFKGPLTSLALIAVHAVVSLFGGDWYRSGVTLNLICAAAFLILCYRLMLRTFNRRVAVCATVGVSLAFEFFLHAHKATSDLLFLLLCYLAVERLTRRGWSPTRLAVAGALGGLAFLTRYNGLIVPLAGVVIVLIVNQDRLHLRRRLIGSAVHVAAFLVVIAPWYAINHAQTGRLLATRNLQNIFVEEFYGTEDDTAVTTDRPDSLAGVIRRNPVKFARSYLANVPDHLRRDLDESLNGHVTLLLVLGLIRLLLFPPRRRHWALLVFPLIYFLAMCAVYYQPRFAFSVWPGWFAVGFVALAGDGVNRRGWLGDRVVPVFVAPAARLWSRLPRIAGLVVLAAAALVVYGHQISDIRVAEKEYHRRLPGFVLDLAPQLKRLAGDDPDVFVMARKPHLAHYAGLEYMQYPHDLGGPDAFIGFAVEHDVRFIVYSEIERAHYPGSLFLAELERYAGVEQVYEDAMAVVYELGRGLTVDEAAVNTFTANLEHRLAVALERGDVELTFQLCVLISEASVRDGDWQTAATYLERAIAGMPRGASLEARKALANVKINLAQSYLKLMRHAEGVSLLEPVMSGIAALLPPDRQATAHACLARHQEHLGRLDLARRHLGLARDLYIAAGDMGHADDMRRHLETLR